jgi:hypothetical protein
MSLLNEEVKTPDISVNALTKNFHQLSTCHNKRLKQNDRSALAPLVISSRLKHTRSSIISSAISEAPVIDTVVAVHDSGGGEVPELGANVVERKILRLKRVYSDDDKNIKQRSSKVKSTKNKGRFKANDEEEEEGEEEDGDEEGAGVDDGNDDGVGDAAWDPRWAGAGGNVTAGESADVGLAEAYDDMEYASIENLLIEQIHVSRSEAPSYIS